MACCGFLTCEQVGVARRNGLDNGRTWRLQIFLPTVRVLHDVDLAMGLAWTALPHLP